MTKTKVCIIGAGPSGLSMLKAFSETDQIEVTCYEKSSVPMGQWQYTWKTGTDGHSSMYKTLCMNAPKEAYEFPDYTYFDHFGKPTGSYPPRSSQLEYLTARFSKYNCMDSIKYNTEVAQVVFNEKENNFLVNGTEVFDYVIVATGHFSVPNVPEFEGFESFNGRIIHSHDFRNAEEFKDQNVLVIGGGYSAEDITSFCWKYGAKNITISSKKPFTQKWPENIIQRSVPLKTEGNKVTFTDGTSAEFDSIILCTGYRHHFPFLPNNLRLKNGNMLAFEQLYKGLMWQENPKLFYIGMQNQVYSFLMFEIQALFIRDTILGKLEVPDALNRQGDIDQWWQRHGTLTCFKDFADYQTDYLRDLLKMVQYHPKFNLDGVRAQYDQWVANKVEDIMTFRDQQFTSVNSGVTSSKPITPWAQMFDCSNEGYKMNNQ